MSWFAQTAAGAMYATAFGSFAIELLNRVAGEGNVLSPAWRVAGSMGLLLPLLALNYRGASDTGHVEVLITSLKVGILIAFIAAGFIGMSNSVSPLASYTPFMPEGWLGLLGAMALTFVALEGYEVIVQTAEEIEAPGRTIPRAIFISIGVAVTIYLLVAIVVFDAINVPGDEPAYRFLGGLGELGIIEAAGQILPGGRQVLLVGGLASTASALNAVLHGSTRIA
ncbi:MAG: amino acid permease [bacterium]|nr:amino acid permease [bacterium]